MSAERIGGMIGLGLISIGVAVWVLGGLHWCDLLASVCSYQLTKP